MKTKICSTCKREKPISDFYRDKRKKDGLYPRCKSCHYVATARYSKSKKGRELQSKYRKSEIGKINQHARAKKYRNTKSGREIINKWGRENWRRYYNPKDNRRRAHWTIGNKIRSGEIQSPKYLKCKVCGKNAAEYHHHKGYEPENYSNVIPVCKKCHVEFHHK